MEQLDTGSDRIEKQLEEAERETDELQKELARLDEDWHDKLKQLEDVKSPAKNAESSGAAPKKPGKLAIAQAETDAEEDDTTSNVVSLARRIRVTAKRYQGARKK